MAKETLTSATVKTMRLMPSPAFITRSTFTVVPAVAGGGGPPGGRLLYLDAGNLPHRAAVIFLGLQIRIAVERIDDKNRPLVAHGHVFAISFQREDHPKLAGILDRHFGAVVIERDRHDTIAGDRKSVV